MTVDRQSPGELWSSGLLIPTQMEGKVLTQLPFTVGGSEAQRGKENVGCPTARHTGLGMLGPTWMG